MWKLSDYLSQLQKCANLSVSEGAPSWVFGRGGLNHLGSALEQASDCTTTEAYELLKNMHFLGDSCSIQAYIKKLLSNSDWEAIINCTNLAIASTTNALLQKAQPNSAAVERSFSMLSKRLKKDGNFDIKMSKNTCYVSHRRYPESYRHNQTFA